MENFLSSLAKGNDVINTFIWTTLGLVLLLATGLLTTVVTKVFQVTQFKLWWKNTLGSLLKKDVSVTARIPNPSPPSRRFARRWPLQSA